MAETASDSDGLASEPDDLIPDSDGLASEPDDLASEPDEPASEPKPASNRKVLHDDLFKEYQLCLDVVSKYDGWLLTVKGWSVTLSLAWLALAIQQRHYVLFLLAAVTAIPST
jgi:hypothetical protein